MADVKQEKRVMAVKSRGLLGKFGRLLGFIVLFFVLLIIGIVKGIIFGPLAALIIFTGSSAITIGLWPAHVVVMYRTIAMTKQLGTVLKVVGLLLLPILLLLWPMISIAGSILSGLGYGFGQPLVATFEAVGEHRDAKFYHTFADGSLSTLTGSCTVVRDFLDFSYHSLFGILDEFRLGEPKHGKPIDIKLKHLPACIFIGLLGLVVDIPAITLVALAKSPLLLYKGWSRLLQDLVGRHGPCLEAACVPFAGLALVLWPVVVIVTVASAIVSSPVLGLFGAVVVYQETSFLCGLAYIVAIVAEFDEYSNDILNLHEGSCLPRPKFRKTSESSIVEVAAAKSDMESPHITPEINDSPIIPQLTTQKSLKHTLQEVKVMQIWDNMFKKLEREGKKLVDSGVLKTSDFEAYMKARGTVPDGKIVEIGLPAYCNFDTLLSSAKSKSPGLLLGDGIEVTWTNRPRSRLSIWFFEPFMTIKQQLQASPLQDSEEAYLKKLILLGGDEERMKSWNNGGVEPEDDMRRGELQALARRLQGMTITHSKVPTHRRRFEDLVKTLEAYSKDTNRSSSFRKEASNKGTSSSLRKDSLKSSTSLRKEGSNRFLPSRSVVDVTEPRSRESTPPPEDEAV